MSELEGRLRRWRFERRRALWMDGATRFAAGGAAYVLALYLLDRFFAFPLELRWAGFGLGLGLFLWGAAVCFILPLKLLDPIELFREAVRRYPALRGYVRSAWELSRASAPRNTSGELVREHLERTNRLLGGLPLDTIFPWSPSRKSSRRLTAVAAVWGFSLPWLSGGRTGFERILSPWRDVRLESLIEVLPGDAPVGWGEGAVISARWRDERSDLRLALEVVEAGAPWRQVPWDSEGRSFVYRVQALNSPLDYRIRYRSLATRNYRLTPVPFPHLTQAKVRLHRPTQSGEEDAQMDLEGSVEVAGLRGSWVSVRGVPDQPLSSARLEISYLSTPVKMKPADSGEWEAGFPLNENGTIKIDLVGQNGSRDPNPLAYTLKALDDQPPAAELLSPAFELEISPKERLAVTYSARDDYGLTSASLGYQVPGRPEALIELRRFADGVKETLGDYSWDLSHLPMGARVEFWIKVLDNSRPRPQAGLSARGVLHLVDFDSLHRDAQQKWQAAESALKRLSDGESAASRRMRSLGEAAPEPAEKLRRDERDMEPVLDQQWAQAVESMEDLARSLGQDPYSNAGAAETTQALAEALNAMRSGELAKAKEAFRSGRYPDAQRRHSGLENRTRKAGEILASGKELQAMQDFVGEASRMDQESSDIQDTLSKLAQGGKPSAQQRRALDEALSNLRREMDALNRAIASLPKVDPDSLTSKNRRLFSLPLDSARDAAASLQSALDRGDMASAARLAKQLSEELSQLRAGLAQAARSTIEEGPLEAAARAMEEAAALWKEVVEGQSRGLAMTQKVEEEGQAAKRSAQEDLLKELAKEQAEVLHDAAKAGSSVPGDAVEWMGEVLQEFEAGQVRQSPQILDRITGRLRGQAARLEPSEAAPINGLADREALVRERLQQGARPSAPGAGMLSDLSAAAAMQKQVSRKTSDLQSKLEGVGQAVGAMPPDITGPVDQARVEQQGAEESLSRREDSAARSHQEKALELLEDGLKSLNQALKQQQSIGQGAMGGFSGPRGVVRPLGRSRGRTGADTSFVPLPRAQDYQPPREIRGELEKSLRERRPRSLDGVIKDYFKRMSQ